MTTQDPRTSEEERLAAKDLDDMMRDWGMLPFNITNRFEVYGSGWGAGFDRAWDIRQSLIDSLTAERDEARRNFKLAADMHALSKARAEAAEAEVTRLREALDDERRDKNRLRVIIADLDRCEHGRHEPDVCDGCGGKSHGNMLADVNVGYNLDGKPWTPRTMRAALATPPSEGGES